MSALLILLGTLLAFSVLPRAVGQGPGGSPGNVQEEESWAALSRRFDGVIEAGDRALEETLDLLAASPAAELQAGLSRIRRQGEITALAVYDPQGRPQAWAGVHRGQVPQPIRRGDRRYAFGGGPLFRYLYFTALDPRGGGTVVAAVLLQTDLPAGLEGGGFAQRFRRETGVPIRILPPGRELGAVVWDVKWDGEPLMSVSLEAGDPERLRRDWQRPRAGALALLAFLAWGALVGGGKGIPWHRVGASLSLLAGVMILPTSVIFPSTTLSSPGPFLLPGPLGATLGKVFLLLSALAVLLGIGHPGAGGRDRMAGGGERGKVAGMAWGTALRSGMTVALLFPLSATVFASAPSPDLFLLGGEGWMIYQGALSLGLSLLAGIALALGRNERSRSGPPWLLAGGLSLALGLALAGGALARSGPGIPVGILAILGLPTFLVALGLTGVRRPFGALPWLAAAMLGTSGALPVAWGTQIQSRVAVAEAELLELGGEPDPFLEFRLERMAERAVSLDSVIPSPMELLFEVWAQAGPREDPLPLWLTLWSAGDLPGEDLAMGVRGSRPPVADDFLDLAREEERPLVRYLGMEDARYVLVVPLEGRRVLSAVVPPSGSLSLSSPLGPVFTAWGPEEASRPRLVPVSLDEQVERQDAVRWERDDQGWRGRWMISFGGEGEGVRYFASHTVSLPGNLHLLARGTLTFLLDVTGILALWVLGQVIGRGREIRPREIWKILGTFRARVTLALFAFFLLSIAIFGTLAFQTLSGAAHRTASALAERVVEDGASFYLDVQGNMQQLGQEVGADLLEYRDGELREGSSAALVQLGLYEGWVPEPVFRQLDGGQEVGATVRSALGPWDYVMAFRRLSDGDILASPVPVEAGATALRRREVADLLGFAFVLGAALSLGLALWVGRTLTRPIEILKVASERVGAGNLRVRLPERRGDEFGAVFEAFNRMVYGIRRARRALIRTTRRTQAIVEEAATGVLALDARGRVTLANPRAESLLAEPIPVGEPLPGREGKAAELVRWVDLYFRDGLREGATELQMGNRRIRIRARRIPGEEPLGGAVLSLEDVTDELRSERILAWGEMARQVAHEVKNPLTPIKLSVQHLQRAWEDRRPEFGEILGRNVEVILREIEHLAAIARSFSRFAAPGMMGDVPLEPVSIHRVAEEVVNLYRGGTGALTFRCMVAPGLPLVRSRESELREVLINLLENSRVAIPEEGEVVIEADTGAEKVELRVRDNGTGIPPGLLPRIFEPHFSTRSTGTGLGLAIVRRLVESWGGGVAAESRIGNGTVVRMTIPLWEDSGEGRGDDETTGKEESWG